MKTVYLLRHAKSSWDDPDMRDFDRPLKARGWDAAKRVGAYMKREGLVPDCVIASPATRTRETIARVAEGLGRTLDVRFLDSLYMGPARAIAEAAMATPETAARLMIVGHNPGLHALAVHWAAKGSQDLREGLYAKFPTGALAEIEFTVNNWPALEMAHGELKRFILPNTL